MKNKQQPYLIKEHKLAELVNELEAIAKTYEGCQCRRSMLAEVVRKHLKNTNNLRGT